MTASSSWRESSSRAFSIVPPEMRRRFTLLLVMQCAWATLCQSNVSSTDVLAHYLLSNVSLAFTECQSRLFSSCTNARFSLLIVNHFQQGFGTCAVQCSDPIEAPRPPMQFDMLLRSVNSTFSYDSRARFVYPPSRSLVDDWIRWQTIVLDDISRDHREQQHTAAHVYGSVTAETIHLCASSEESKAQTHLQPACSRHDYRDVSMTDRIRSSFSQRTTETTESYRRNPTDRKLRQISLIVISTILVLLILLTAMVCWFHLTNLRQDYHRAETSTFF